MKRSIPDRLPRMAYLALAEQGAHDGHRIPHAFERSGILHTVLGPDLDPVAGPKPEDEPAIRKLIHGPRPTLQW